MPIYYRYVKVSFSFSKRCICTDVKYIHQQGFSIAIDERGVGETQGLGEYNIVQTSWLGTAAAPCRPDCPCRSADARFSAARAKKFQFSTWCHRLAEKHLDRLVASLRAECSEQREESNEPQLTYELHPIRGSRQGRSSETEHPVPGRSVRRLAQGGRSK